MMGPALKVRGRAASTKPDLRNFREPQARAGRRGGESQAVRLSDAKVRRASILPLMEGRVRFRRSADVDSRSIPVEILAARPTMWPP